MSAVASLDVTYVEVLEIPAVTAHAIQVVSMARAFARLGHRATLFVRRVEPGPVDVAGWLRDSFGFEPEHGLAIVPLASGHKGLAGLDLRRRLLSVVARSGPRSLLLGRNRRQTLLVLRMRALLSRTCRVVYEVHNLEHVLAREKGEARRAERIEREERRLFREVDGIVAISAPLAEDLVASFEVAGPVAVVPDGVDLDHFRGIGAGDRTLAAGVELVYAGSLFAHKGVDALVGAVALLPQRVRLTVVGGNSPADRERLEVLSSAAGTQDRVRFTGQVPPREVATHLARADLLVLPAGREQRSQRYTSPLKLFEAMATGTPIVAAPSDALTSILTDGRTAVVAPGADATGLAAGVLRALADPGSTAAMGRAAMRDAEQFSWLERARKVEVLSRTIPHR